MADDPEAPQAGSNVPDTIRAASQKPVSLMQRIHQAYDHLPDGERRVADLVLDSPGELALWPASELAERSGVSAATVSRFFRRLGYDGYDAARRASRTMRAAGSPLYLTEPSPGARRPSGLIAEHLAAEHAALDLTLAAIGPHTLGEICARLATARRVRVLGFRNSYFVAEYLRASLALCRPDVQMINWNGQTAPEGIGDLGPGDVAVVVGLRRRPRNFGALTAALAGTGADVALIADPTLRGAPAVSARWSLTCATETPQAFDTLAGALALARLLAAETMARLGPDGRRHLERIERLHDQLEDLE